MSIKLMDSENSQNFNSLNNNTQKKYHVYRKKNAKSKAEFMPINNCDDINQFNLNQLQSQSLIMNTEQNQEQNIQDQIYDDTLPFDVLTDIFYKNYYDQGVHDFIVNKMYSLSDGQIEFFICDFIFWTIVRGSVPLEGFLIHRASTSMQMFFLIYWQLESFSEVINENKKLEKHLDRIENLILKIEQSMVKGSCATQQRERQLYNETLIGQQTKKSQHTTVLSKNSSLQDREEKISQLSQHIQISGLENMQREKDQRSQYSSIVNKFINNLVDISLTLKAMTKPQRKECLTNYILKTNRYLKYLRNTQKDCDYYHGITIPFQRGYKEDFSSSLIVSLVPKQFICFETRQRVPYRIVVETIDVEDLKKYKPRKALSTDRQSLMTQQEAEEYENPQTQNNVNQDNEDLKQNKYKEQDLLYLQEKIQQEIGENAQGEENLDPKLKSQKSLIQQFKRKSGKVRTSHLFQRNSVSPLNQQRTIRSKQAVEYMNDNDVQIGDQNIENFHRNYGRLGSLSPDFKEFSLAQQIIIQKRDTQSMPNSKIQKQNLASFGAISEEQQSVMEHSPKENSDNQQENIKIGQFTDTIKQFNEQQNVEEQKNKIPNFGKNLQQNSGVQPQKKLLNSYSSKKLITTKKQKYVYKSKLTPERQMKYDTNIIRFNIMFKPLKYMQNQIKRRFSFSETQFRIVKNRRKQYQQIIQDYYKNTRIQQIHEQDLTISKVLKFFKDLMEQYPEKLDKIDQIYRYLNYDLIEQNIQQLGDQDLHEFPRKFGPWGELWSDRMQIIKKESPYGHFPSYKIRSIIIKGGDDLRQELICMQLITLMDKCWKDAGLNLWLKPYEIIVTSSSSGIIGFLANTQSIDGLKKQMSDKNLCEIYHQCFGKEFETKAQKNFIKSFAAYSIVSYVLQVKDRHNGNILIDNDGHMIHIDFGFIFSISPGNMNFESAPFKFTKEYGEIMGGFKSEGYQQYKQLVYEGFNELRKPDNLNSLCNIIEIMSEESDLPCYTNFKIAEFRDRFKENLPNDKFKQYVENIISQSYDAMRTVTYDWFQKKTNGILP